MKAFIFCLFLLVSFSSFACLNEHHVTKSGKAINEGFWLGHTYFNNKQPLGKLQNYLFGLRQNKPNSPQDIFENQNSIAVTLIKLGRLSEAEPILNQLYKEQPDDYSVLSNLGTLYELQGKNKMAFEFISRAMQVNPVSHLGSEWFHLRVLEFKLKNVEVADIPATDILKIGSIDRDPGTVATEISYQLEERIPFTPVPDMVMAKILDEYAGFLAEKVSIKAAYLMYDIATGYDPNGTLQLQQKKAALKPFFVQYKQAIPVTADFYGNPVDEAVTANKDSVAHPAADAEVPELKQGTAISARNSWLAALALIAVAGLLVYRRNRKPQHD